MITTFDEGESESEKWKVHNAILTESVAGAYDFGLAYTVGGHFLFAVVCVRYAKGRDRASGHSDSRAAVGGEPASSYGEFLSYGGFDG